MADVEDAAIHRLAAAIEKQALQIESLQDSQASTSAVLAALQIRLDAVQESDFPFSQAKANRHAPSYAPARA